MNTTAAARTPPCAPAYTPPHVEYSQRLPHGGPRRETERYTTTQPHGISDALHGRAGGASRYAPPPGSCAQPRATEPEARTSDNCQTRTVQVPAPSGGSHAIRSLCRAPALTRSRSCARSLSHPQTYYDQCRVPRQWISVSMRLIPVLGLGDGDVLNGVGVLGLDRPARRPLNTTAAAHTPTCAPAYTPLANLEVLLRCSP